MDIVVSDWPDPNIPTSINHIIQSINFPVSVASNHSIDTPARPCDR